MQKQSKAIFPPPPDNPPAPRGIVDTPPLAPEFSQGTSAPTHDQNQPQLQSPTAIERIAASKAWETARITACVVGLGALGIVASFGGLRGMMREDSSFRNEVMPALDNAFTHETIPKDVTPTFGSMGPTK